MITAKEQIRKRLEALETIDNSHEILTLQYEYDGYSPEQQRASDELLKAVDYLKRELLADLGEVQVQIDKTAEELNSPELPFNSENCKE